MGICVECGGDLSWMRTRCPNCGFQRPPVWPFLLRAVAYFLIAFLLTRFDITLPVEIWSMLRSGLSPRLNAIGSLVFLVSVTAVLLLEILVFRKRA